VLYCCPYAVAAAEVVTGSTAWIGRGLSCVCAQRRDSDARLSFDLTPVQVRFVYFSTISFPVFFCGFSTLPMKFVISHCLAPLSSSSASDPTLNLALFLHHLRQNFLDSINSLQCLFN
jgi:hypothetical protein